MCVCVCVGWWQDINCLATREGGKVGDGRGERLRKEAISIKCHIVKLHLATSLVLSPLFYILFYYACHCLVLLVFYV